MWPVRLGLQCSWFEGAADAVQSWGKAQLRAGPTIHAMTTRASI